MANRGRNTNSSQFFITTNACSWCGAAPCVCLQLHEQRCASPCRAVVLHGAADRLSCVLCARLDRKHVVFGEIQDGLATLMAIDEAGSADGTPTATVEIVDCGEITAEGAGAEE